MPVHNVETYLAKCVNSILQQALSSFEVVLVDDGSTDRSSEIAAGFASRHPHVRLISQGNAGLGAARNAGVGASRGKYLTFVDSDDFLPSGAYAGSIATLEHTGSDFAVGKLKRDDGQSRFASRRMRNNHRTERLRVTLEDMPEILADVFAVNKVFRRSFWESADLRFPTGIRYEDQPTLTAAFLRARAFDVLTGTVYFWRVRTDGSSITQQRHHIADLHDRVATKRSAHTLLQGAPPHVRRVWLTDVLPVDMGAYFRSVPGCSNEYWTTLRDAVREFWKAGDVPFEQTLSPVQNRLLGWLVGQDRRADVEELVAFIHRHRDGLPFELRDGTVICLLPGHEEAGTLAPREVYELAAWERQHLRTRRANFA